MIHMIQSVYIVSICTEKSITKDDIIDIQNCIFWIAEYK